MKLSMKIFLGICIPAVVSIIIISMILIGKTHDTNIEYETDNFINLISNAEKNIADIQKLNIDFENIFESIQSYYNDKGVYIYTYLEHKLEYGNKYSSNFDINDILNISQKQYGSKIYNNKNKYYMCVSTKLDNGRVLVFEKSINDVYETSKGYVKLCIIVSTVAVFIVAIIAYIISRTLTKPLNKMNDEMLELSKGNYDIKLPEGKNEVGILAKNFNQMSNEIEKRNNELLELLNSKQLFIDNLSHEMNTPLTSIIGYSELMQKANLNEEQKVKFLNYINQEAKRILDMYKKLLLISYKKNNDFELQNVELNKIFNEVQILLEPILNEKNIKLNIYNHLSNIWGDETLILMCVTNLVKNALNVSNVGDVITINAFSSEDYKFIHVIDNGPGIKKEDIDKIMEPFYRVDKARSRNNGGAGLGLSICKTIMDMHKGSLNIESEVGKGSCFILKFNK